MSTVACGGGDVPTRADTTSATAIDPSPIPNGDGMLTTTTPQIGFVYSCTIRSSLNPAGKAPWISADGLTWNSITKVTPDSTGGRNSVALL